jgi:DNA invertase Pin-like site-specific DNA recombinase
MKCVAYLRVSGNGQISGDGFPRQFDAIHKFCDANKLTLGRVFREEGVSGSVEGMERPQFFEMVSTLSAGDAIVVERVDRFARTLMVSEVMMAKCRELGVKVYAADRGCLVDMASDGADPTVVLIRQVLAAVAEFDKSSLVRKLRAARDRKRAMTGRCEGIPPYGGKASEALCLKIVDDMRKDAKPFSHIAKFLNESGFLTRWGKAWTVWLVFGLHKKYIKGKTYARL